MIERSLKWEFEHGFRHDMYTAGAALVATGLVGQAVAGYSAAFSAKKAADYNSRQAAFQAQQTLAETKYKAGLIKERLQRTIGEQRANYGASGVTLQGSPELVQRDTMIRGFMDEIAVENSGKSRAAAYSIASVMADREGESAFWRGILGTTAELLKGGGMMAAGGPPGGGGGAPAQSANSYVAAINGADTSMLAVANSSTYPRVNWGATY